MLRAVLQILAALLGALPKLIEEARAWKRESDAAKSKAAKDARNADAIKAAQAKEPAP